MASGPMAAGARRSIAVLVLGWLAAVAGVVLLAPAANAGTSVTIGKAAPAPVTVNSGETVTFVNGIPMLTVTVPGVVPATATVATNVILGGPCGGHTLAPGASYSQTFTQTSTCSISYAYSVQGATLAAVQALLPPLPSPTSLLVTVVQAGTNPGGSAPPPAPAPAPAPGGGGVPAPAPAPGPIGGGGSGGTSGGGTGGGGTGSGGGV